MSSVGKISLDLSVNNKKFNKQVDGIQKQTTKAFEMMSVAIGNIVSNMVQQAVSGIGNFVKDSINKGSELSELQNVVDSVFTTMADRVEEFSRSALSNFGLTESQSKKMMGTFGAMSKSFGYTEGQAYNMSAALTGLAGDVASFYNLNHDEAYTKMKSVFTGETESLKELGVVMTQTALDEFAMAKGFSKTTKDMSEQEKVALRLAFVQDKLSTASGDFLKTQDQWANQTRILSGQFDNLKAALGQGFINVLTPLVRTLNTVMAKLVQLANLFKDFTAQLMGVKSSGGAGAVMSEVAEAADSAAASTGGIEKAAGGAAKAAKEAKKSLMGFDEINKITSNNKGTSGSDADSMVGGSIGDMGFGNVSEEAKSVTIPILEELKAKMSEIITLFSAGFEIGIGDDFLASIERVKAHIASIGDSLKYIFVDDDVSTAANDWVNSAAYALGQASGAIVSVAQTIAENLIGGIDMYLQGNKERIRQSLVSILDVSADYWVMTGDLTSAVASIFEVFRGDTAQQITTDLISIVANASLGIIELALKIGKDIIDCISQPIIDNKELIATTIEGMLEPVGVIVDTLANSVTQSFDKIRQVYDENLHPMFQAFAEGLSELVATLLSAYNEHIKPVLDNLAAKFKNVWEENVQPAIDSMIEYIGKLANAAKELWEHVLQPLIDWAIKTIVPILAPILHAVGDLFLNLLASISTVVEGIFNVLGGLIDFIVGVFTGDWELAWEGLQTASEGAGQVIGGVVDTIGSLFEGLSAIVKGVANGIIGFVEGMANGVINGLNSMIGAMNKLKFDIPDWVPGIGGESFGFNISKLNKVSIPRLAEGGYLKANQPTLAMVGDNKTQGEIVSPEGKMLEVMLTALESFFGKFMNEFGGQDREAGDITIPIYLDGTMLDEVIVTAQQRRALRAGGV